MSQNFISGESQPEARDPELLELYQNSFLPASHALPSSLRFLFWSTIVSFPNNI
jgi:hypothetical protein